MTRTSRWRTYLAVPAHRGDMLDKAAMSPADAVFMDLEDAVPTAEKAAALASAAEALTRLDWGGKHVSVRLNAITGSTIRREIADLCAASRLDAVILPKVEAVEDVRHVADWIAAASGSRTSPVSIELLIETALGVLNVEALAAAGRTIAALHFGAGDFSASIGARSVEIGASPVGYRHMGGLVEGHAETPQDLFAYPMMRILVAARAFGLRAIDGPCAAFGDLKLTKAMAAKAAAMGFDGKQVIHPSQISPTRDAFTPSEAELAYAKGVIAAVEKAAADGQGAIAVDGRMIDEANLQMARRMLQFAGDEA